MIGPNLSEWAIGRRSLVVYFMIVGVVAGSLAFFSLGRNEDPAFTFRTMVVQAAWPGRDPRGDRAPGDRAHRAQAPGGARSRLLDQLHPPRESRRSSSICAATRRQREVPDRWYDVRKKVGDIRHTLPKGVVGPFFNDEFGDVFGIIYGFTADGFTHRELRDYVEEARSRLLRVPDVSKIEILGAQDERIYVEFSTHRLAELGLDYPALVAALQAQNAVRPAGVLQTATSGSCCGSRARSNPNRTCWRSISSSATGWCASATSRDPRGYADPPQPMFRVNGKHAIGARDLDARRRRHPALGRNISDAMAEIKADLPVGIEPLLVADQAVMVDLAINEFTKPLVAGDRDRHRGQLPQSRPARRARSWRCRSRWCWRSCSRSWKSSGIDLQRISLGALIIALALLVDDAMITVEAMVPRLEQGDSKESAATFAYRTLAAPMLTGTLVTIAGFVPVGFAASSAGEYTFSIFAVVGIALIVSWFVAAIFAPLIGMAAPEGAQATRARRGHGRVHAALPAAC